MRRLALELAQSADSALPLSEKGRPPATGVLVGSSVRKSTHAADLISAPNAEHFHLFVGLDFLAD